jgi:hypothetical protein
VELVEDVVVVLEVVEVDDEVDVDEVEVVDVAVDVVLVPKLKNQRMILRSMWLIFKKNLVHYSLKL